jgi:ABC-type glutathione transport system ATPase component
VARKPLGQILKDLGVLSEFDIQETLRLQKEKGTSFIFITHDLAVARHMSDEILVMKDGRVNISAGPLGAVL